MTENKLILHSILKDIVIENTRLNGKVSWLDVQDKMKQLGYEGSTEMWRSRWRSLNKEKGKRRVSTLEGGIGAIEQRKQAGENIEVWYENGEFWYETKPVIELGSKEFYNLVVGKEVKVALLGDTHIGSDKTAWGALMDFYKYAYRQGVRDFYHTGDMTDGMYKNRDNSFFEQTDIGFQQQLDRVVRDYPKIEGVTTYFITGNHDVTHLRNGGANIGETIEMARPDMCYLGHNFGKVWLTNKCDLALIHPTDGGAQAVTHRIQKIIDAAEGQRRAKIMAVGHYHKMAWVMWKGVHGVVVPSFQRQTDFMRDNNLKSYVGGYILTLRFDTDGELLSVLPEFVDLE